MWKRILAITLTICAILIPVGEVILCIEFEIPQRLGITLLPAIAAGVLTVWADNK